MHIFLQGQLGIGKSTIIKKVFALFGEPLKVGGFVTFVSKEKDVFINALNEDRHRATCVARFVEHGERIINLDAFNKEGVSLLRNSGSADIICMDELGFLESLAEDFIREVLVTLDGSIPILGVLRDKEIPWHMPIKSHPAVTVLRVSVDNRNDLPESIYNMLREKVV